MKVQDKSVTIEQDFATSLHQLMGETFEDPIGIYLDKDTSLFQTLETVSAQEASIRWRQVRLSRCTGRARDVLYRVV